MDIVIAVIGLALAVIVAAYVAQPLVAKSHARSSASEESPRDKLVAERDAVYAVIRDLDFDFQTGKLLEADYRPMRETYVTRGVEILKQLDAVDATRGPLSVASGPTDGIEAAVRDRRRRRTQAARPTSPDDEIEAAIRARRQSKTGGQPAGGGGRICPSCGHPFDSADRFCAKCGAALTVETTR